MTSVLFLNAAGKSAVQSSLLTQSTGTPSSSSSFTVLTSPAIAARWKWMTRSLSISTEETVKLKQFDVCETLCHSVQSSTYSNASARQNKTVSGGN